MSPHHNYYRDYVIFLYYVWLPVSLIVFAVLYKLSLNYLRQWYKDPKNKGRW
jgi:hypothetical protein